MNCELSFLDGPCDGPHQRCHLIPRQRLRRAGIRAFDVLWDERILVVGCARHHHLLDSAGGYLPEADYPESVREFAAEHGFVYSPRGWVEQYTPLRMAQ